MADQVDYINSAVHNRQQSQVTPGGMHPSTFSGGASGNNTAISGGRKPTADSHSYTLYQPHKIRGKFSTGGSIDGGDHQDGPGYASYNTGPSTTANRFYNAQQSSPQSMDG